MHPHTLVAEARTVSAFAQATPALYGDTTPYATTLTVPATGTHDIAARRIQRSHCIADGGTHVD
jgi:hypothetical protein